MNKHANSQAAPSVCQLIRVWRSRKISDTIITKLLEMYFGIPGYMNEKGAYPIENLYDLSRSLRFRGTRHLVEAVQQCGSFVIEKADNPYSIKNIYSPVIQAQLCKTDLPANDLPNKMPNKMQTSNDIYNIYNPKGEESSVDEQSPDGEQPSAAVPSTDKDIKSDKNNLTTEALATAREFFHQLNESPEQRSQTLTPLIDRFQQQEGITREHARENVIYLVNELLIPYFASQPHFLRTSHAGRLAWLNNLLKSAHGAHLIAQAAQACRTRRLAQAAENHSRLRDNHPLSPHEWTDPATSSRFYDDEDEGMVPIPTDAPPRPSDTAVWNVISKEWRQ